MLTAVLALIASSGQRPGGRESNCHNLKKAAMARIANKNIKVLRLDIKLL
jgi:hypothetical protein